MNIVKHLRYYWRLAVVLLCVTSAICTASVAYTYDAAGRMVAANYGAGNSASYAYDNAGNLIVSSQPSPGLLVSRPSASQINLVWLAAPDGFVLEESPTLGSDAVWTSAGATLTLSGNFWTATIPITGSIQFYRLRKL